MQHRDKQWSNSWICCFFFLQPNFAHSSVASTGTEIVEIAFSVIKEGLSQNDAGLSQQRTIKACNLFLLHRTGWPHFPMRLCGRSRKHAGQSQQVAHTCSGKSWKMRVVIAKHTLTAIAACGIMFLVACYSHWQNRKCALLLICQPQKNVPAWFLFGFSRYWSFNFF